MNIKKITQDDFRNAQGKYKKSNSVFWQTIESLQIDEGVRIDRSEWENKTNPIVLVSTRYATKRRKQGNSGKKFIGKTLDDDSGWMILRSK